MASSAISVMRDEVVLLYNGVLLITDSGFEILATLYVYMIAGLMRSLAMV